MIITLLWMIERGRKDYDENGNKVLLGVFVDITEMVILQNELRKQARALTISEERFRIALEKTSNIIFEYDPLSGEIRHSSAPKKTFDFVSNINQAQNTLFLGGRIMEKSMKVFNEAFAVISNGGKHAECVVKVKLLSDKEIWVTSK